MRQPFTELDAIGTIGIHMYRQCLDLWEKKPDAKVVVPKDMQFDMFRIMFTEAEQRNLKDEQDSADDYVFICVDGSIYKEVKIRYLVQQRIVDTIVGGAHRNTSMGLVSTGIPAMPNT